MGVPKVLIITPIYSEKEYCLKEFLSFARKINYPNFHHLFIDNSNDGGVFKRKLQILGLNVVRVKRGATSREALTRAQAYGREKMLRENYDYMLSLESDVMHPPDIVQLLLYTAKDVVSALYMIGDDEIRIPCITLPKYNKTIKAWGTRLLLPEEIPEYVHNGLQQVQAAGMGCCLIARRVLEKIEFYFDPRFRSHSDVYFFNDCFDAKIPVFVQTDILLDHQNSDWTKVKDR